LSFIQFENIKKNFETKIDDYQKIIDEKNSQISTLRCDIEQNKQIINKKSYEFEIENQRKFALIEELSKKFFTKQINKKFFNPK
jgi:hypothetical protein